MTTEESVKLADRIKAGKLRRTQGNAEKVKAAWSEIVQWNHLFHSAGLAWLPDPEDMEGQEKLFEDWIVKAYASEERGEEQVRAALLGVRSQIIAEAD